jgi:TM2 domain-containing membrane protein YozV
MDKLVKSPDPDYPMEIQLRNPMLAAFLAWLIPGLGHLYQGRRAKGLLFMICILGIYLMGFWIGGGKVVYASFRAPDVRFPYLCQIGVGLPALPALVQRHRVLVSKPAKPPLWGGFMAPPQVGRSEQEPDQLADWHRALKGDFELGTLYTMIAGLLNVLAIYDALAGPVFMLAEKSTENQADENPPEDKTHAG